MNTQAAEYRGKLEKLRKQSGGRRWRAPAALRDEITEWAARLGTEGHTAGAIAAAIGLSESALRRWLSHQESPGELRRVCVGGEPEQAGSGNLVVVTPGGYRLEGLSVSQAVDVLRRL